MVRDSREDVGPSSFHHFSWQISTILWQWEQYTSGIKLLFQIEDDTFEPLEDGTFAFPLSIYC